MLTFDKIFGYDLRTIMCKVSAKQRTNLLLKTSFAQLFACSFLSTDIEPFQVPIV